MVRNVIFVINKTLACGLDIGIWTLSFKNASIRFWSSKEVKKNNAVKIESLPKNEWLFLGPKFLAKRPLKTSLSLDTRFYFRKDDDLSTFTILLWVRTYVQCWPRKMNYSKQRLAHSNPPVTKSISMSGNFLCRLEDECYLICKNMFMNDCHKLYAVHP